MLVTTEEFPPVVEVDDDYLGHARPHFHWLLKVNSTNEQRLSPLWDEQTALE